MWRAALRPWFVTLGVTRLGHRADARCRFYGRGGSGIFSKITRTCELRIRSGQRHRQIAMGHVSSLREIARAHPFGDQRRAPERRSLSLDSRNALRDQRAAPESASANFHDFGIHRNAGETRVSDAAAI